MKRMASNFPHGGAMDTHFANMRSLIQILDGDIFELMHQNGDYTHFYFCYRWFLLDFKRGKPFNWCYDSRMDIYFPHLYRTCLCRCFFRMGNNLGGKTCIVIKFCIVYRIGTCRILPGHYSGEQYGFYGHYQIL